MNDLARSLPSEREERLSEQVGRFNRVQQYTRDQAVTMACALLLSEKLDALLRAVERVEKLYGVSAGVLASSEARPEREQKDAPDPKARRR